MLFPHRLPDIRNGKNRLLAIALLAVIYYLAARWSLLLAFEGSNASPVWPPSGIALGALLLLGRGVWPAIALGAFAANLTAFSAAHAVGPAILAATAAIAIGNTLEALAGFSLLHRLKMHDTPLDQPQHVFRFMMTVLLMCTIGAGAGTATVILGRFAPVATLWPVWINWWLGDVGGILLVTPLIVAWMRREADRPSFAAAAALKLVATLALFAAVSALVFGGRFSAGHIDRLLLFACMPCLAWIAFNCGHRGVTVASLLLSGIAIGYTTRGVGPFATGDLNNSLVLLVSFIVLSSVTGLILAADIFQRALFKRTAVTFADIRLSWFTLLSAIGMAMLTWHMIASDTEKAARARLERLAGEVESEIGKHMSDYEQVLRAGSAIFAASQEVTRNEWRNYVEQLEIRKRFPGLQLIAFNPWVSAAGKAAHTRRVRAEGFPEYAIWPAGRREGYAPITYIEPFDQRNRRTFGFDSYSEPVRRAALAHARDTGMATVSGKVGLIQDNGDHAQAGFVMFVPVYRQDWPHGSTTERRAALQGFVSSAFRMDVLVEAAIEPQQPLLGIEIYAGPARDKAASIYRSAALSAAEVQPGYRRTSTELPLAIGDHVWTLRATPLPAFEASIDRQKAQIILVSGFIVSLLLFVLVRSLAMTRENALALADDMTAALRASEAKLRLLNSRMELATAAGGIGVWDWDIGSGQLSWGTRMYEIYGLDPAAASNRYDMWRERVHPHDLARVERALSEALAGGPPFATEFDITTPRGATRRVKADAMVVRDAAGSARHMTGTTLDVTDLRQAEESLRTSEARFRSIFEHAPIGMAIVALDGRWLSVNTAICGILGYDKQELEQTIFLQDVTFPADLAGELQLVEQLKAGRIQSYQMEKRYVRKDGQTVWALLTVTLMRDEASAPLYFIKQIMNITERIQSATRLQASLAEKEVLLKEVYHRVKNNLQVITSLFNLQLRALPEGPARSALQESAERVRAMALVHEKLYQSGDLSSIALDGYIHDLCRQLATAAAVKERGIALITEVDAVDIGLELAVPLGLLLNELVSNSLKHGFPDGRHGEIRIRLARTAQDANTVVLEVSDNGVGLPPHLDMYASPSLGLKLVGSLAAQIDARFVLESRGGVDAKLIFRVDSPLRPDKMDIPSVERV